MRHRESAGQSSNVRHQETEDSRLRARCRATKGGRLLLRRAQFLIPAFAGERNVPWSTKSLSLAFRTTFTCLAKFRWAKMATTSWPNWANARYEPAAMLASTKLLLHSKERSCSPPNPHVDSVPRIRVTRTSTFLSHVPHNHHHRRVIVRAV